MFLDFHFLGILSATQSQILFSIVIVRIFCRINSSMIGLRLPQGSSVFIGLGFCRGSSSPVLRSGKVSTVSAVVLYVSAVRLCWLGNYQCQLVGGWRLICTSLLGATRFPKCLVMSSVCSCSQVTSNLSLSFICRGFFLILLWKSLMTRKYLFELSLFQAVQIFCPFFSLYFSESWWNSFLLSLSLLASECLTPPDSVSPQILFFLLLKSAKIWSLFSRLDLKIHKPFFLVSLHILTTVSHFLFLICYNCFSSFFSIFISHFWIS